MLETLQTKLQEIPNRKDREVVIIYPFNTETKEIFLIQEYIHSYARKFWKFVSGGVDKLDKDILTHAIEELAEEVSMESSSFFHLYSSERVFGNRPIHYFIAENPVIMENPPENPHRCRRVLRAAPPSQTHGYGEHRIGGSVCV